MRTLKLYAPEIVLLVWAAVIWRVGRTDTIVIVGLCVTAVTLWGSTQEIIRRYQKGRRNGHHQRHP